MNDASLRADLLAWADILARGTGSVPAVDVAWKLRQLAGATPTTGPAPAAADVQWLPATFVNTAGGVGCASCNGYQALGHDGECYPYGQGPTPDRLPPNTRIVAVPQAPAQPTDDEYGENVIVPNLARPSAPAVDGDTPTSEEKQ